MVNVLYENEQSSINRNIEWMSPNSTEPGRTANDFNLPANYFKNRINKE